MPPQEESENPFLTETKTQVSLEVLEAMLAALLRMQSILEIFSVSLDLLSPLLHES